MAYAKAPHHSGTHQRRARIIVALANADSNTRCGRPECGLTRADHPPTTKTGKPNRWTAGHVNDGEVNGALRPEMLTCNCSAGATLGNQRREPHSEDWYGTTP
jgi:hypothetical protein